MLQKPNNSSFFFAAGILASALIHAAILAPIVFDLPMPRPEPEEPRTIEVELEIPEEVQQKKMEPAGQEKPRPPQILRPVYKFAEKDDAAKSLDGELDGVTEATDAKLPRKTAKQPEFPEQTVELPKVPEPDSVPILAPRPDNNSGTTRSQKGSGQRVATTAMAKIPRGIRVGELCVTELRQQLQSSVPPYWPDLLPTYQLDEGTLLQVRQGAFRASSLWYNLRFRCEIDEAATHVVSFEFEVGAPIPRADWASRGFPAR